MARTPDASPLSTQVFMILLSLAAEEQHGYAIIQDVARRTEGDLVLTASTLYAALKRLVEQGWIVERANRGRDEDARRRYYALTDRGRAALRAEARRLDQLATMARGLRLIPAAEPRRV